MTERKFEVARAPQDEQVLAGVVREFKESLRIVVRRRPGSGSEVLAEIILANSPGWYRSCPVGYVVWR
ncbi:MULTISPECIES: hypothetical protein [unclassified Streptomyces]|uniref:hypothetical protein n=1 Tax=unclassified Streptomyces TaxID=2593676 RepID=UPI0033327C20